MGVMSVMASLIPVSGEISDVAPPNDVSAVCRILGAPACDKAVAFDGSSWWVVASAKEQKNERATSFFNNRCGLSEAAPAAVVLFGDVLYLSSAETAILTGAPVKDEYVPVRGRTYDVKEKLKAIGARWHGDEKVWKVPKALLADAEEIVRKGP